MNTTLRTILKGQANQITENEKKVQRIFVRSSQQVYPELIY